MPSRKTSSNFGELYPWDDSDVVPMETQEVYSDFLQDIDMIRIPTVRELACRPEDEEDLRFGEPQTRFDYLVEIYGSGIAKPY